MEKACRRFYRLVMHGNATLDYSVARKTFMAIRHGNKTYMQILLDPHRAALLADLAKQQGVRSTAWIRDAVYAALEKALPSSVYQEALAKDQASWRESVRRRVEGRSKNKKAATEPSQAD
jgi:hypothetical protein|tara:strand:+ start:208 stop:567 length:360 start_codon:yes stop_codon:yes gene_type:complete